MAIFSPSNYAELREMLEMAIFRLDGPVAVRYPRGAEGEFTPSTAELPVARIHEGGDITLVSYGIMINQVLRAAQIMEGLGYSVEIIKLNLIKPLDSTLILDSVRKTGRLVVVEDICHEGCMGQRILAAIAGDGIALLAVKLINLGSGVVTHGSIPELMKLTGLDAYSIARESLAILGYHEALVEETPEIAAGEDEGAIEFTVELTGFTDDLADIPKGIDSTEKSGFPDSLDDFEIEFDSEPDFTPDYSIYIDGDGEETDLEHYEDGEGIDLSAEHYEDGESFDLDVEYYEGEDGFE